MYLNEISFFSSRCARPSGTICNNRYCGTLVRTFASHAAGNEFDLIRGEIDRFINVIEWKIFFASRCARPRGTICNGRYCGTTVRTFASPAADNEFDLIRGEIDRFINVIEWKIIFLHHDARARVVQSATADTVAHWFVRLPRTLQAMSSISFDVKLIDS